MVVGSVKTSTIIGSLQELSPIRLELVSQLDLEPLWDQLVATYHFLGYRKLLGRRLKYLAFVDEQPVAALSWSAPALKLRVRDRFIGWSEEQRRCHLHHIANNSRFIVFPWVKVNNLASHQQCPVRFLHKGRLIAALGNPRPMNICVQNCAAHSES
jgi:hypothetical protein